jgi:hypothetical protein
MARNGIAISQTELVEVRVLQSTRTPGYPVLKTTQLAIPSYLIVDDVLRTTDAMAHRSLATITTSYGSKQELSLKRVLLTSTLRAESVEWEVSHDIR